MVSNSSNCSPNPCEEGYFCCENNAESGRCCQGQSGCCCPDGLSCCTPENGHTVKCTCVGNCPGPSCHCIGCEIYNPGNGPALCQGGGNVTAPPLPPFVCQETNQTCSLNPTCCVDEQGQDTCCPYVNATCCGVDNPRCCKSGMACDPINAACVKPTNSTMCSDCQSFVELIETKGCDEACAQFPPPLDVICGLFTWVVSCDSIIAYLTAGWSPEAVCQMFDFCAGGPCSCGYCTSISEQQGRCLSLPNICPGSSLSSTEIARAILPPNPLHPDICFDGTCSSEYYGCCLTCF